MSYKKEQVESTLKRVISQVVARRLSDPRIVGLVSVTRVDVSPDGHNATVCVSVLPEKDGPRALGGLRHATGRIHAWVCKEVAMRYVPRLTFRLDDSLKKQDGVFDAIRRGMEQDRGAAGADRGERGDETEEVWGEAETSRRMHQP